MAPALEHENAIAVDCTLGLAGHSIAFLKAADTRQNASFAVRTAKAEEVEPLE